MKRTMPWSTWALLIVGAISFASACGSAFESQTVDAIVAAGGLILIGLAVVIWQLDKIYGLLLKRQEDDTGKRS